MAENPTTGAQTLADQWMWPVNSLPAYFCVVCDRAVSGTDYRWRMKMGDMWCEYAHPSCLEKQHGQS